MSDRDSGVETCFTYSETDTQSETDDKSSLLQPSETSKITQKYKRKDLQGHNHTPGTRFRYVIHGVPKNRHYSVEEARWSWKRRGFVNEHHHSVSSNTIKTWLGYIPSTLGESKIAIWLFLPYTVYPDKMKSPLKMWDANHDVFAPFSFEKLRYHPRTSQSVFCQASEFPQAFRVRETCEECIKE